MAHIEIIDYEKAEQDLKAAYDVVIKQRGQVAEVLGVHSLHPKTMLTHLDLYMSIMYSHSPLSRAQREMIAVVVSVANGCMYCQTHHADALQKYWKDETKVTQLKADYTKLDIKEKEKALCAYAISLTKEVSEHTSTIYTDTLRSFGFDDRAILDATMVIGYFNFVNRMVMGLGVQLDPEDNPENYKY